MPEREDGRTQRRLRVRLDPDQAIEEERIERLLERAGTAPSAYNLQPWRFLVIREPANRRRLSQAAYGQATVAEAPVSVIVLSYRSPERSHLDLIVQEQIKRGLLDERSAREFSALAARTIQRWPDSAFWALRAGMMATSWLIREAEQEGLAALLIEDFDHPRVRREFGIPDDHVLCSLISLGVAVSTEGDPGRLALAEITFSEHFGQPWRRRENP